MSNEDSPNTPKWYKSRAFYIMLAVAIILAIAGTFKGIADFIVSLSWPAVVLTTFWYLRKPITKLITERHLKLNAGGLSLEAKPIDQLKSPVEPSRQFSESDDYIRDNPDKVRKMFLKLIYFNHHLHSFILIYGSQIKYLDFLYENRDKLIASDTNKIYYTDHSNVCNSAATQPLSFSKWFEFLRSRGLIELEQERLTPCGEQFIEYVRSIFPDGIYLNRQW